MFDVSKIISGLLDPAMIYALVLAITCCFATSDNYTRQKRGLAFLKFLVLLLLLVAFLPVGKWALAPLENYYARQELPQNIKGIILLTGDENPRISEERGQPQAGAALARYVHLARLARRYPEAKIIVAGTTVPLYKPQHMSTELVSRAVIDSVGIRADRVQYEVESRTTRENALNCAALLKPKEGERWVVVTSGYHMPRSVLSFKKIGFDVIPSVSDFLTGTDEEIRLTPSLGLTAAYLRTAAHEYFGLLAYWYLGWVDAPWD